MMTPSESTPPKEPIQQEIVIPPDIIRPFGRGLRQLTADPLEEIGKTLPLLESEVGADNKLVTAIREIKESFGRFDEFLTGLEAAKEVKIAPHGGRWTLVFSEERDETTPPTVGEVIMNESMAGPFASGFGDKAFNIISGMGFSYLMLDHAPGSNINKAFLQIQTSIEPFRQKLAEIRIITDQEGNTVLNPVLQPD